MNRTVFTLTLAVTALGLASDALAGWGRVFTRPAPAVAAPAVVVAQYAVPAQPTVVGHAPAATTTFYPPVGAYYAPQAATTTFYAPPAAAPTVVAPRATYYAPGGTVITTMPRHRVGRPIITTPTVPSTSFYAPGVYAAPTYVAP